MYRESNNSVLCYGFNDVNSVFRLQKNEDGKKVFLRDKSFKMSYTRNVVPRHGRIYFDL